MNWAGGRNHQKSFLKILQQFFEIQQITTKRSNL